MTELTARIIKEIRAVPPGRVASYGEIARRAGSPRGARQVVRVLHSYSASCNLPWHRILGKDGKIRLPPGGGLEDQAALLSGEGIELKVSRNGEEIRVDMGRYGGVTP